MFNSGTSKFKYKQATVSAAFKNNAKQGRIDSFFCKPKINEPSRKPTAQVIKPPVPHSALDRFDDGPSVRYKADFHCTKPVASV